MLLNSGNLITFGQFLFMSLERLAHFNWRNIQIPLKIHLLLVSLFVSGFFIKLIFKNIKLIKNSVGNQQLGLLVQHTAHSSHCIPRRFLSHEFVNVKVNFEAKLLNGKVHISGNNNVWHYYLHVGVNG